jgi:hypothetical protein
MTVELDGLGVEPLLGDRVFFALGAQDAIDRIGGSTGRFVVVTHLHFSQQAYRQHIESSQDQHRGEDHQGTMIGHDRSLVQEFLNE